MSGLVGYTGITSDAAARALVVTAADGRQVSVTRAEARDWIRDTRPRPTLDQGSTWLGQTLTARWNALPGVQPLAFHFHIFTLDPFVYSWAAVPPDYALDPNWWVRPAR